MSRRGRIATILVVLVVLAGSLALSGAFVLAAARSPRTGTSDPSQTFQLTIGQGEGGGQFTAGRSVEVFGLISPLGRVFDRWVGQTDALADARGLHTQVVMPAADVTITATFRAVPVWLPTSEVVDGRRVTSYFPADHKALILFFHGEGGNGGNWFDKSVEQRMFLKDAVARGYAVAATESGDRAQGRWDLASVEENADIRHVADVLARLRRQNKLRQDEPVYAVGFSRGGDFATLAASSMPYQALALYGSRGHLAALPRMVTPTMWCLSERDSATDNGAAIADAARLSARGIPGRTYLNKHAPAYLLRFTRIEGVTSQISRELHRDMERAGVVSPDGIVLVDPTTHGDEIRRAVFGEFVGYTDAVLDQLTVAYGQHAFYSDANHLVLDFFDQELTSVPRPTATPEPAPSPTSMVTRWAVWLPWNGRGAE